MGNEEKIYPDLDVFETRKKTVISGFIEKFEKKPTDLFSSSGRIELLGNHTDHNYGEVLTAAVNLDMLAAVSKRDDNKIVAYSAGYIAMEVDLSELSIQESELSKSIGMIRGVAAGMVDFNYKIGGFNLYMISDIFGGAGVSSSAAFELLFAEVLNYYYNDDNADRIDLAKIAQFSEINYFGKPCGLLDQMAISLGGVNHIDFEDINKPVVEHISPLLDNYSIFITNTGGDHSSLTPHYAAIKDDMALISHYFKVDVLRSVKEGEFYRELPRLRKVTSGRAILRAIHFFDENKRVKIAYDALKNNDISTFLKCINASGDSSYKLLQNCYYGFDKEQGVTLGITLSKKIIKDGAVRVHGGGFAGTILAIVNNNEADKYAKLMRTIFGKENCVKVVLRPLGATHI